MNELLGRDPPRWVLAIAASPEETDYIARRVNETGLPPEPALIGGQLCELKASGNETSNTPVKIGALEVHDKPSSRNGMFYCMNREGGITLGALEACVARWRVNDERKTHVAVELDGAIKVGNGERNLIQVHENL